MSESKISLNKQWRFHLGESTEAFQKGYNDSEWREVTLPHDWAVEHPFSKEHSSGTGYLPGGVGWYRKRFELPGEAAGKRVFLAFDGVYKRSQVWFNSVNIGKWANGYTPFMFDVTGLAQAGETDNVVSVRVEHNDIADSRWFTGSGMTRGARVIVKNDVYICPKRGVFFRTPNVGASSASVEADAYVVNRSGKACDITARFSLRDASGGEALSMSAVASLNDGEDAVIAASGMLENPKLWSVDNPNLYTLVTTIDVGGALADTDEQTVGVRSMRFDPQNGFFLNDVNMKLKGVCVHHDAGCLGAAVPKAVWRRRLDKLRAMGCNAIRMSHNPHAPELYELCDEMGFLVIDECFDEWENPKNKWWQGHNVYPPKHQGYAEDFPQWHAKDIEAWVLRGRNHPCVMMWSIGNEVDYPNDPYCHPLFNEMTGNNDSGKPSAERMYNPDKPNAERLAPLARELKRIVKLYDTTRPVTAAAAFPELSGRLGFTAELEVVGYNYKEHLYAEHHAEHPDWVFLGSENSHRMEAWKAVHDNDYISGQFLWTGIDFLGETHGWPLHGSGAGVMTTAGFEKPSYYLRKGLWSDEPFAWLCAIRKDQVNSWRAQPLTAWNFMRGEVVEVRCYTNQKAATLTLNGKPLGEKPVDDETGYIAWDVPFEAGELAVSADGGAVSATLRTASRAAGVKLTPYADTLRADGEDVAQIVVSAIDSDGNEVPAGYTLRVVVEGDAKLMGIDNGDHADNTPYTESYRRLYKGKAIIYVRAGEIPDDVTVRVTSDELAGAEIVIKQGR